MVNSVENEALSKSINNGPRVSFNRDVHVKRYGSLLNNDSLNFDSNSRSQSPANLRRELPTDLSDEALEREAALVLEQVNNFGSLPHRKQQYRKPIRRSKSDASSKKTKRNSIFNIFNSTNNLTSPNGSSNNNNNRKVTNEKSVNSKKVERSKSDVSSRKTPRSKVQLNSNSFNSNNINNSSDSSDPFLTSTPLKKAPLSPITEVNSPLSDANSRVADYFDIQPETDNKLTDVDFKPISTKPYSKSMETMHSSQMPAEKPSLTKGMAVDKMIKRLSNERLSPPPAQVLQLGGFSYTNPQSPKSLSPPILTSNNHNNNNNHKSDIVYAQVVCNETKNADGSKAIHSKETVHNTLKTSRQSASPPKTKSHNDEFNTVDTVDFLPTATPHNNYQYRNSIKIVTGDESVADEEPIIRPNIRHQIPRHPSNTNINHITHHHQLDNEFDRLNEMRETDFNGIDASLSSRREILESRIKSRIGGLHINNDNGNHHNNSRSTSPPPPTSKRYHKYGSNEIISRYSPERSHLDLVSVSHEKNNKSYVDSTLRKKSHYYSKRNDSKVDSGVETDSHVIRNNRKNRYSSRFNIGRKWNYEDDIIECELFLMKERKHTEETYPYHLVRTYVYRERSIDDGSHYDPNLDKANILKEWKHNKKMTKEFIKAAEKQQKKKKSSIDKVKELFKSKNKTNGNEENELRSRYREYSPELEPPPKSQTAQQDISNRRRLSTPTASPVITSRSKSLPPKGMKKAPVPATNTLKRDKEQKFNWFTSLERLSRRRSKDTTNTSTIDRKSISSRAKPVPSTANGSTKTLRFFGDTDGDDTDRMIGSRRHSSSQEVRQKSSSLQNLNSHRKTKQNKSVSRSRTELQNISESTSDTEFNTVEKPIRRPVSPVINKYLPPPRPPKSSKLVSSVSTTLPRSPRKKMFDEDEAERDYMHGRDVTDSTAFYQRKENFDSDSNFSSARKLRDSLSVSRENLHRERFDSDASQRSVVYLHATTVGDIPSQTLNRRVSGKGSVKVAIQEEKPIARTVNRSVSLSAPWKPKFISDGYEINYNNDQQKDRHQQNRIRSKSATRERERRRHDRDSSKRI